MKAKYNVCLSHWTTVVLDQGHVVGGRGGCAIYSAGRAWFWTRRQNMYRHSKTEYGYKTEIGGNIGGYNGEKIGGYIERKSGGDIGAQSGG